MRSAADRGVAVRRLRSRLISVPPRGAHDVDKGCLDMAPFDGGFHAVDVATLALPCRTKTAATTTGTLRR